MATRTRVQQKPRLVYAPCAPALRHCAWRGRLCVVDWKDFPTSTLASSSRSYACSSLGDLVASSTERFSGVSIVGARMHEHVASPSVRRRTDGSATNRAAVVPTCSRISGKRWFNVSRSIQTRQRLNFLSSSRPDTLDDTVSTTFVRCRSEFELGGKKPLSD